MSCRVRVGPAVENAELLLGPGEAFANLKPESNAARCSAFLGAGHRRGSGSSCSVRRPQATLSSMLMRLWEPIPAAKEALLQRNTLCAATPPPLSAAAYITHREV